MRRTIVEPAEVSGAALADLKTWLGISRPNEDALLIDLLEAGLAMCEAFTGQAPLEQVVEERVPVLAGQYALTTLPVENLVSAEIVAQDASRTPLDPASFTLDLQASGKANLILLADVEGQAVAVQLQVGIADSWENVPAAIKQGLIRLAAFQYRARDRAIGTKADATPPSSVFALWRPWRTLRLR